MKRATVFTTQITYLIRWRSHRTSIGGHAIVEIEFGLVVREAAIVVSFTGWNVASQWILQQELIDALGLFQLQLSLHPNGHQVVQQLVNFLVLTTRLQSQIVRINWGAG